MTLLYNSDIKKINLGILNTPKKPIKRKTSVLTNRKKINTSTRILLMY